jgi:hypothetical protein
MSLSASYAPPLRAPPACASWDGIVRRTSVKRAGVKCAGGWKTARGRPCGLLSSLLQRSAHQIINYLLEAKYLRMLPVATVVNVQAHCTCACKAPQWLRPSCNTKMTRLLG